MNINLKQLQEEFKKEYNNNKNKIEEYEEIRSIFNVNQIEFKGQLILFFAMLGYCILLPIPILLSRNIVLSFPMRLSLPALFTVGTIGIGLFGAKTMAKKFKAKEKLERFSRAKTETEKMKDEIRYKIEIEKLKNRNVCISELIKDLEDKQNAINILNENFNISEKINLTGEETPRIKETKGILESKNNELDDLSTKKVLHEKFWRVRDKATRIMDNLFFILQTNVFCLLLGMFSLLMIGPSVTSPLLKLIIIFSFLFIGSIGSRLYASIINKKYLKVFSDLNRELCNNSMSDKLMNALEEEKSIHEGLAIVTQDIIVNRMKLEIQRIKSETYKNDESQVLGQIAMEEYIHTAEIPFGQEEVEKDQNLSLTLKRKR